MNPKSNSFTHIFHVFFSSFLVNPRPSLRAGISFLYLHLHLHSYILKTAFYFTRFFNRDKIKVVCPYLPVYAGCIIINCMHIVFLRKQEREKQYHGTISFRQKIHKELRHQKALRLCQRYLPQQCGAHCVRTQQCRA